MQEATYKIFNASAGSGKTFTLVTAYLKIILSSNSNKNFRKILAITFTNKAVNEMKQRILKSLFQFGQNPIPEESGPMFRIVSKDLKLDAETLQKRSKRILKEILHNYAFFDVSTIDKFTHRLIRTFAKDLKLPQNFEVVLDTDLLLDEAVARLINRAGTDEKLTKVLLDFALEKIDDDKSWDIAIDLKKIGKLLFDENHAEHLKKLEGKSIDDFLMLKKFLQKEITSTEKEIKDTTTDILTSIENNGLAFNDFKSGWFPKFILKIDKGDFKVDFNAGWKQNFDTDPLYAKSCTEPTKSILDQLHPRFTNLFHNIKKGIYNLQFKKNMYQNMVPLTVLNAIRQETKALELERDQLPISSFNTLISNEIKDQPAPFIYERLGEKYQHYFIDEFQDTSEMQWHNLIPLIGNALEGENEQGKKGSLLLVGDAKQAIYRWRGGKAEQFLNLMNLRTNPFVIAPETESLPTNYRSHEEVIKFNNDFFTVTSPFLNHDSYNKLFLDGNNQQYNAKQGGSVQLRFIEEGDEDELYCEEVLKAIQEVLAKKHSYRDICILTRKRKHGIFLADFLIQQGIPIISSETLLLNSSPKVKFLIDLLNYTISPTDLETSYKILYFLATKNSATHTFIQKHLEDLSAMLRTEYGFDLERLKQSSVFDGLEYAIKQFDLVQDSNAYVTHLMDTVFEVEQKEGTSTQAFLAYWEKKKEKLSIPVPEESSNALQIMTIHKSKGLEFPIVIFPYANSNIYEEIDPKIWAPVQNDLPFDFDELLISKKQEVVHYGAAIKDLYDEEQHKLELDAFNLLYVALTRAKKALYIISKKYLGRNGEPNTKYYSGLFIHYLKESGIWDATKAAYSFGELTTAIYGESPLEKQQNIVYPYSSKDRPSFNILTKSGVLWDTEREDAISKGNLIHSLLSHIETGKDVNNAFKLLIENGNIAPDEINFLETKVLQIINHPQLKMYYEKGNIVRNEKDIITENGLILRPDRVVIKDKKATIIDYKTGRKSETYHEQLYRYADALVTMGYEVEHRIIIYIDKTITPEFV
ncbi:MAG: UvrD-helicase domain-containing protein [Saonia sp.]